MDSFESMIHTLRGQRVMLDADLARFFDVETKRINETVRRNLSRFPLDFAFQLLRQEVASLRSQSATSNIIDPATEQRGGRRTLPWAFTEHGVVMLAAVLNSPIAMEASVRVVRAFVRLREFALAHRDLSLQLKEVEERVGSHGEQINVLFDAIRQMLNPPRDARGEIGFHKQEEAAPYKAKRRRRIT